VVLPQVQKGEYGPGGAPKSTSSTGYVAPTAAFAGEQKPVSPTGTQLNVDAVKVYGSGAPAGYDVNTNTENLFHLTQREQSMV